MSVNDSRITGFTIIESEDQIDARVDLNVNENFIYRTNVDVENFNYIKSVKLSGRVNTSGSVKVYLNDRLVLDKSNVIDYGNTLTGFSILNESFFDDNLSISVNQSENNSVALNFTLNYSIIESNLTKVNETIITENETLIENISQESAYIEFANYCDDTCSLNLNDSSVEIKFEISDSSIQIDEISYTIVSSMEEFEDKRTSSEKINETTFSDEIVIEEDISWTKIIQLNETGIVNVTLPGESKNIVIKKKINNDELEVKSENLKIDDGGLFDFSPFKYIYINDDSLEYIVYYQTPGPDKKEKTIINNKDKLIKNISISSDLHLFNITSFADLPNVDQSQIKLLWFDENDSKWQDITNLDEFNLTYIDLNNDEKYERVYWTIPHLSEESFSLEISLLILNVQSYPQVGGNWKVYFNTTGTADLIIEAVNGTTWSNTDDNKDLRFLELKCGAEDVSYSWIGNKVTVNNYNCDNQLSIENSKVFTGGRHNLKFTFGNLVQEAHNEANGFGSINYEFVQNNQFLRMWNNFENYCVNLSSGIQFGVDVTNDCSGNFFNKNEICLQVAGIRRCYNSLPLERYTLISDNLTYVNLTFNKTAGTNSVLLTYTLFNTDLKLYQAFIIRNNFITSATANLSYVLRDIQIGDSADESIEINGSIVALSGLEKSFTNLDEDGFSVIDPSGQYFHLNYPYLENNAIWIKNSVINVTLINQALPAAGTKSLLFTYFDPAGTCTSLVDIYNTSTGCVGNQFSVEGRDSFTIGNGQTSKVAFRFNATNNMSVTHLSFCLDSVSGTGQLVYGLQYDGASSRPNGTWIQDITNSSTDVLAGCYSFTLNRAANITKNLAYHVVLDGSFLGAGVTKTPRWINPKILKYPLDYGSHPDMLVATCCPGSKWITDSDGTNLFVLRGNKTDINMNGNNLSFGWSYDTTLNQTIYGLNVVGQVFRIPFIINISHVGFVLTGGTSTPPDNISYVLRRMDTGESLTGAKVNITASEFVNGALRWVEANLSNNITILPNVTYNLMLFCNACDSTSDYKWEKLSESTGYLFPGNTTWDGVEGFVMTSSNNGSTWTTTADNNLSDTVFRLTGIKLNNTEPNWSTPFVNQSSFKDAIWVNFSAIWSDDNGLSGFIFEIDQGNGFVNSSFTLFPTGGSSKLQNSTNITFINASVGTQIRWRYYANDSFNYWNVSQTQSFTKTSNLNYIPNSGLLVYSNNNATCATRIWYKNQTWSKPLACPAIDTGYVPRIINLYSSKTRNETIMLMKSLDATTTKIYAHVWNGAAWSNITQFTSVTDVSNIFRRYFDGCYLNNGDFMAVYGKDVTLNGTLYFRVWNGTVWTGRIMAYPEIGGNPEWIDVKCRPDGNEVMVSILDSNSDVNTLFFNNTNIYTINSWGFLYEHTATLDDVRWEGIDLEWSNNDTSQGVLVYVNGTSPQTYVAKTWNSTNGNLTFGQGYVSPNYGYTVGDVIIKAHPNNETYNNSFLTGISRVSFSQPIPIQSHLIHNYSPAFTQIISTNITNFSDVGQQRDFDIAWEKSGTEAIIVYDNQSAASGAGELDLWYRLYNVNNGSWSNQMLGESWSGRLEAFILKADTLSSEDIMLVALDTGQSIFTKYYNGTNNTFSAGTLLGSGLGTADTEYWADFAWDQFQSNNPPNWSSPVINQTHVFSNQSINFSVTWSDDFGLSGFIIEINQSVNYVNSSFTLFPNSGTLQKSTNITFIKSNPRTIVSWRIYANDSSNNWNVTSLQTFRIEDPPNVTLSMPANNSDLIGNNFTLQCNITDELAIENVTLYHNFNGTFIANITRDYGEIDPVENNYVLIYHFNNDANFGENITYAYDFSRNNNNGTIYGNTGFISGYFRDSWISFIGGDPEIHGLVNISYSDTLNISTNEMTLMAWAISFGEPSNDYDLVSKAANNFTYPFYSYGLAWDSVGRMKAIIRRGSDPVQILMQVSPLSTTWHHYAMTFNGTALKIYYDGFLSATNLSGSGNLNASGFEPVRIGKYNDTKNAWPGSIEEVVILNRSLSDTEIFEHYNRSLNLTSKSENFNFTNLVNLTGRFYWNCLAYDNDSNYDWGDANFTFVFNTSALPFFSIAPSILPTLPTTVYDLNCSFVVNDTDTFNALSANVTWRRNNTLMFAFNMSIQNTKSTNSVLNNLNTTRYDDWNCTVHPFDGFNYGSNLSTNVSIYNALPLNVTLLWPNNGSTIHERRPFFNWTNLSIVNTVDYFGNTSDPDKDIVNFSIVIDEDIDFLSAEVNFSTRGTNFTPSNPLPLIGGGNTIYYWKIITFDNVNHTGNSTETRSFTLESLVSVTLINNKTLFGTLNPGDSDATHDDNPNPIKIENDGNTMLDINLSLIGLNLWNSVPSPTSYFMYKVDNRTEPYSFNYAGSQTTYSNVPIVNTTFISLLNHTNATDLAEVDFNLTVPSQEIPGIKSANISFTAIIGE